MIEIQEDDFLVELTPEEQEELKGGSVLQIPVDRWEYYFPKGIPNPFPYLNDRVLNSVSTPSGR